MLYCEGRHKPMFRGVLHHIFVLPLPIIGFAVLYTKCSDNIDYICAVVTSLCIFSNLLVSSLWHRYIWDRKIERLLQKMDFICILLTIYGTYFPFSFFYIFPQIGLNFLYYLTFSTIAGITWIVNNGNPIYPHIICSSSIFILRQFFTNDWILFHFYNLIFIYFIGLLIFKFRKPDPFPNTFGYHEIFHVCVITSMIYTYYVHYHLLS
jgi:hemolysin III